ncbi:hypothetical protein [Brevibacterium sp.]|uniref:hypothetical protein n=1 Tax=Brevibacterium sp. TaxID=1701 RepID=UPI0025BDEDA6|nr:hypothetical protein [Brevibacterium sp.]
MLQFRRSVPLVRRNGAAVQFGVDEPVLLDGLTEDDLALLDVLCRGCSEADLFAAGSLGGGDDARTASLLGLLREADLLEPESPAGHSGMPRGFAESYSALHGLEASAVAGRIAAVPVHVLGSDRETQLRTLTAAGFSATAHETAAAAVRAGGRDALTVLMNRHTHDIAQASALFAEDAPHLSVRIGDRRAEIVPVLPGTGPCAVCAVLSDRDGDPDWFEAWTQLSRRSGQALVDPLLLEAACLETARLLRGMRVHGTGFGEIVTVDGREGAVSRRPGRFHPECDCRIPLSPSGAPAPAPAALHRTAPA